MNPEYITAAVRLVARKLQQLELGEIEPYELTLTFTHRGGHPVGVTLERFVELRPSKGKRSLEEVTRAG